MKFPEQQLHMLRKISTAFLRFFIVVTCSAHYCSKRDTCQLLEMKRPLTNLLLPLLDQISFSSVKLMKTDIMYVYKRKTATGVQAYRKLYVHIYIYMWT